jgi:hypothetical protein
MKEETKKLLTNIFLLIVGALIGFGVQILRDTSDKKRRFLDVKVSFSDGIFSRPDIQNRNLEILLDNKPIKNLASVDITIYNFSDRDYDNVPVYIDFEANDPNEQIEIIKTDVAGAHGIREQIESLQRHPSGSKRLIQEGYQVKTLNRPQDDDPVFQARYLFLGDKTPKVSVYTVKTGLEPRLFSFPYQRKLKWLLYLNTILF